MVGSGFKWMALGVSRLWGLIDSWHERVAERRRLLALPDRLLSDIGIGRGEAWAEYRKPFWRR
jgi:uncharacterized protein YjiS (DUF1127 family)